MKTVLDCKHRDNCIASNLDYGSSSSLANGEISSEMHGLRSVSRVQE